MDAQEILNHLNFPKKPYSASVRKFALVLSAKSKSSYKYVRKKFANRLPNIRTIQSWHQKSNTSFSSGFCEQTLETLKKCANDENAENRELYVSMCFDEMATRRHIQWIHNEKCFSGLITYGQRIDDEVPVANNAIFFLVTMVKTGKSLVLCYFLIKTLNTLEKSTLIQNAIDEVHKTGSILTSIAFDGLRTNFSACEQMGASFQIDAFKPYLVDSATKRRISIVLDPPHTIKLIRNCLAAKSCLKDDEGNDVNWFYFERLLSKEKSLVSHKLTKKHIDFSSNKMNVGLAAQTLSFSVARSMEILRDNNDPLFLNSGGTINFIKNFNKGFDIFNSKHSDSINLFKRGLNEQNAEKILDFLRYFTVYLKSLKLDGKNILESSRKTGFLGFLMNISTLYYFYTEFVLKKKIENILFFYFGQDILESLFSRIRSMLGSNTNPTVQQLNGILRQMIVLHEIEASEKSNCQDNLDILNVSSEFIRNEKLVQSSRIYDEKSDAFPILQLNFKELYTVKLRAGTIEKKIRHAIPRCGNDVCKNIFKNNIDKIDGKFFENGLAQRPTKSTVAICEIIFNFFLIYSDIYEFNYSEFYRQILIEIPFENLYTQIDFSHDLQHKSEYILLIIDEYIRMHATYLARITTLDIHTKYYGKTSQKLKHFSGQ